MAENEILDIGSSKRYRRWKEALTNAGLSAADVATVLPEELLSLMKNKLRKVPLYLIFQACKQDAHASREAIAEFKEISLANLVQNAFKITGSGDPNRIAIKIADLIVDGLINRSDVHIGRDKYGLSATRQDEIHNETVTKLQQCKPELVRLLSSSLNGELIKPVRAARRPRPTAQTVVSISLRA